MALPLPVISVPTNPQTNPWLFALEWVYQPFFQTLAAGSIAILGSKNIITSFTDWPLKTIATYIIGIKWAHSIASELVRLYIAGTDATYSGDLIAATSV